MCCLLVGCARHLDGANSNGGGALDNLTRRVSNRNVGGGLADADPVAWDTEETRRRLKEAAVAEFAERGADGTATARIAERAGINK